MKEFVKELPKDFINSNKHIRVIKEGLGMTSIFFVWLLILLYINPGIAFSIQGSAQEILGIPVSIEDVLVTISCIWFLPLFFWCLINLYTFEPFKMIHSIIPFISLCVSVDVLGKMLELNVTEQYYNLFLIALFILTVVILVENTRIKLVNIATMKRSYQKGIIAHGDEVSVDIVLGKKSRFAFLKKLYKPTTYFYYDGNTFHECIDNGLEEYDYNELILGTKDAMNSTLGTIMFKNIVDATIYIPDEYTKSRKYYYGVIRYLEHVGIGMWSIKFTGSNQSEIIKANSILETIKKHDMYLHEENETMSKPEYVEDAAGIYDYSPFYMQNIKLCMEDNESFERVSREMSERTKMSIEITAERLKQEGVTLP